MGHNETELYSIGEFAVLSRTSHSILRHYEKMGLLRPAVRKDNKFRFYSIKQLATINTIRILHGFGLSTAEISALITHRTPELALEKIKELKENLVAKMDDIVHLHKLLITMDKIVQSGINADMNDIVIVSRQAEPIILGKPYAYKNGETSYDALLAFYRDMSGRCHPSDMVYPVWGIFSEERVRKGDYQYPDCFYLCSPNGQDRKPAATYAIGHTRAGYGQGANLYKRIIEYIDQNGYEICGDAYEEYPLNEFCIADDQNFLMRIMITVHKK